jgi:hypothetical protein
MTAAISSKQAHAIGNLVAPDDVGDRIALSSVGQVVVLEPPATGSLTVSAIAVSSGSPGPRSTPNSGLGAF